MNVIETGLLPAWNLLVGSAALIAIMVLALCVMIGVVKPRDVTRNLAVIVQIHAAR